MVPSLDIRKMRGFPPGKGINNGRSVFNNEHLVFRIALFLTFQGGPKSNDLHHWEKEKGRIALPQSLVWIYLINGYSSCTGIGTKWRLSLAKGTSQKIVVHPWHQ